MAGWLDRSVLALEKVLALALIATVIFCFVNVIARYAFASSMLAADELQVFYLTVMVFLGAIVVTARRQHLRMSLVAEAMHPGVRKALEILESVVTVLVAGFAAYQSFHYVASMRRIGRVSDMAEIPVWIIHACLPVAFLVIALLALGRLTMGLGGKAKPVEPASLEAAQ